MALRIEDYGLIGDLHTAALVGTNGSIDWLCLPRFDSPAVFASLLGTQDNGFWQIAPQGAITKESRRYLPGTLVLETTLQTADGTITITDAMPPRQVHPHIVRIVEGVAGQVTAHTRMRPRFDYGKTTPWVHAEGSAVVAIAGPDAISLRADVHLEIVDDQAIADFTVKQGDRIEFTLTHSPSWEPFSQPLDATAVLEETTNYWTEWSARSTYDGRWADEVQRSLITLKALIYAPSGGIVAAATTSLPEFLGGVRNWDYRFCWLRDAALTLNALMAGGYVDEATAWRDWVLRAVAGDPEDIQIMYGLGGERRLDEYELPHLPGYEGSTPVRVGNAASGQLQLDVYGEVIDAIYRARQLGMASTSHGEELGRRLVAWIKDHWAEPDDGVWEVRGGRRQFVHSKVMIWVAVDRMEKMTEELGIADMGEGLRALRDEIHQDICEKGFDKERNTFTQYYGSTQLDASLLLIPMVGFLPPSDPRVVGTVEAIERELVRDGFVMRYIPDADAADGLPPGEGAFLACSFWLVNDLALIGRKKEAEELFDRLLSLRNDLGIFSEEYDQANQRLIGNTPQAFTHLTLIASALALSDGQE
jgi:GH15 family glucan-1,4-alpha-glucosidase